MDKSLQERLVGAAVLVALGVWLIPWVLDGSGAEQVQESDRVALKLPVPEHDIGSTIRRETIDLRADRRSAVKSPPDVAAAPTQRAERQPESSEGVPAQSDPVAGGPAQRAADTRGAAAVPVAADSEADSAPQQQAAAAESSVAESAPDPTDEILAAVPVAGWMVQTGSFSDAGNARRQARRVETYGHEARIYEFSAAGGRRFFRVRLGPVETRERAEAAASALATHGFTAQLIAPD